MSVLVFIESQENIIKKTSLEAASMAFELAKDLGVSVVAVTDGGISDVNSIGSTGISTVINLKSSSLGIPQVLASALAEVAKEVDAKVVIAPHSTLAEGMVSSLSIKLNATAITNVIGK